MNFICDYTGQRKNLAERESREASLQKETALGWVPRCSFLAVMATVTELYASYTKKQETSG